MKALIVSLLLFTSFSTAFAKVPLTKIELQTLTILRNNGFVPIDLEISRAENPIVFIAEVIIDSIVDEVEKDFREVHFINIFGQMPMMFNCLIQIEDNSVSQIFSCKAKTYKSNGIYLN